MTKALFHSDDLATFQPTEYTVGPWRPDAQHGGPPSALLCLLAEQHVEADEVISRCHVELRSAVPLTTLTSIAERTRISSRVAQIKTSLLDDHRIVAAATTTVLRQGPLELPGWSSDEQPPPRPGPESTIAAPDWASGDSGKPFHRHALEHRFVDGGFLTPGPARNWMRLSVPVVAGVELTSEQRVMACTDIGSGISAVYPAESRFGMINADLDVTFMSHSDSDWLMLDASTHLGPSGTGVATTTVWSENTRLAHATQVLLGYRF